MKSLVVVFAVLALVGVAGAANYGVLGYSDDTVIHSDMSDQCSGVPVYNHDFSAENGYCWQMAGTAPPYYGAFGEAYDVGPVNVECGLFWLTQIGYYTGQPLDAYVWDGGVDGPPNGVLCVVPGNTGLNIGFWPTCTMNEVQMNCCVTGDFTVGYWANFSSDICGWYVCVDENGFGGYPWTCVAPGIGYPTGWQPPSVIWGAGQSLFLGATITDHPSAPQSRTWGAIKEMFND